MAYLNNTGYEIAARKAFNNLSLISQIFTMPIDIQRIIFNLYLTRHIYPSIIQSKRDILNILKSNLTTSNCSIIQSDLNDLNDLVDFDFRHINNLLHLPRYAKTDRTKAIANCFEYVCKSITSFIEYYYSLSNIEKDALKFYVLEDKTTYLSTYNYELQILQNRVCDYIHIKNISHIIDPDDCHSGSSMRYCINNAFPFIFGTKIQALEHWILLIKGHFVIEKI